MAHTHENKKILIIDHLQLSVYVCRVSYSRPEGAPALCDDPRELCQPPGIHLEPLQRVIPPSAPGPVIEVIFIKASLQAGGIGF